MTKEISWKSISRFEGPERSPGFLLWQVSTSWRRQIEAALATIGLTHVQFVLLASVGWLTRNRKAISQVELAKHCCMDITMTSQVLRTLEKKGLIERRRQEDNEKSKFPYVTRQGTKVIESAIPLVEAIDRAFFEILGDKIDQCLEILCKLKNPQSS